MTAVSPLPAAKALRSSAGMMYTWVLSQRLLAAAHGTLTPAPLP